MRHEARFSALFWARLATRCIDQLDVSRAARSAPRPKGPPRASDLLLDSLATLITEGSAAAGPMLWEATRTFTDDRFGSEAGHRWGWMTVLPTYVLWDEESTYRICVEQL